MSVTHQPVLIALCGPRVSESELGPPASNPRVASEAFRGVDTVNTRLRPLFSKFGVDQLPHTQKRAVLAEPAIRFELVSPDDR